MPNLAYFFVIERRVSDSTPASREFFKEHSAKSNKLITSNIGGSQPFNRFTRFLNQRPSFTPSDDIPRRLSWDRYIIEFTVNVTLKINVNSLCNHLIYILLLRGNHHYQS